MTGLDGNGLDDTDKPATEEGAQPKPTSDPDGDHLDASQGQGAFDNARRLGTKRARPVRRPRFLRRSRSLPRRLARCLIRPRWRWPITLSLPFPSRAPRPLRSASGRGPLPRKAPSRAVAPKTAPVVSQSATGPVRPTTLAVDVGGTGLKASVLDAAGKLVADRVRVVTPHPCPPQVLIDALAGLVRRCRLSTGFRSASRAWCARVSCSRHRTL